MSAKIIENTIHDYHSSVGLSKSMLSVLADCPARFHYQYILGGKGEDTPSLRLGNAMHVLALEPDLWAKGYHVLPEGHRRDARTEKHKEQTLIADGRVMITTKEHETVLGMAEALVKNPTALSLLKSPGRVESSIYWQDGDLQLRCRPDLLRNDALVVDLKTARSVKPSLFFKDAFNMHYDLSVALTNRGYEALNGKPLDNYIFLCIESEPPYLIEAYESFRPPVDGDGFHSGMSYLELGNGRLDALLAVFKHCFAMKTWPGYCEKIEPMGYPRWANLGESK